MSERTRTEIRTEAGVTDLNPVQVRLPEEIEDALKALTIRGVWGSNEYRVNQVREYLLTQGEVLAAAQENCAEALYERAMSERRVFSSKPEGFTKRWRDEPYVPPLRDGASRPTDWRDQWREEARAALASLSNSRPGDA